MEATPILDPAILSARAEFIAHAHIQCNPRAFLKHMKQDAQVLLFSNTEPTVDLDAYSSIYTARVLFALDQPQC